MILNISGSSSVRNALDKRYHWTSVDPSDGAVLLWDRLADFPLAPDSDDELSWKWTASGGLVVILPALHILHCTMEQLSSTVQIASGRLGHPYRSSFSFGLLSSIDIGLLIDAFDMG